MIAPLLAGESDDARILVGPGAADDAGVFRLDDTGLVATVDFITPVCDDPARFGRVAAANSLSDVWAMGGTPLFALNLCCFPAQIPHEILAEILQGAAGALRETGAALLGGHTVEDAELKYGLSVVGRVDPQRMITNAGASAGERLVLTKPIGTGVLINAFKKDRLDAAGLEPALRQMERLNDVAARLALEHGVRGGTDVTGFGLAGHALSLARGSRVAVRIELDAIPVHDAFAALVAAGVTTGSTTANRTNAEPDVDDRRGLDAPMRELLYDPQTSGGLLVASPADRTDALLRALGRSGHVAAVIGEVVEGVEGGARLIVV